MESTSREEDGFNGQGEQVESLQARSSDAVGAEKIPLAKWFPGHWSIVAHKRKMGI
jgi:hypothetical protein